MSVNQSESTDEITEVEGSVEEDHSDKQGETKSHSTTAGTDFIKRNIEVCHSMVFLYILAQPEIDH